MIWKDRENGSRYCICNAVDGSALHDTFDPPNEETPMRSSRAMGKAHHFCHNQQTSQLSGIGQIIECVLDVTLAVPFTLAPCTR